MSQASVKVGNFVRPADTASLADVANAALTVEIHSTVDATCFVVLAPNATGQQSPGTCAGLTANPNTGTLTATAFVGPLTGNVTGNVSGSSGSCTGNSATATLAATATVLATARDINGVSFNGSANITVTAAAGTLSGTTLAAGVVTSSLTTVGILIAGNATAVVDAASDTAAGKLEIAIQSEMETATDTVRAVTPGRVQYHPGVAKGWVRYDSTATPPTVLASHNVSSLTDNGVGDIDVNWGTDFSSAEYCVTLGRTGAGIIASNITGAGAVQILTRTLVPALVDVAQVHVAAWGDQ